MYIKLISLGGSLIIIIEVLVVLVEFSTINKIIIAVQVLIIFYYKALLIINLFLQLEQLTDACNTNLKNGFMATFVGILVMLTAELVSRITINLSGLY